VHVFSAPVGYLAAGQAWLLLAVEDGSPHRAAGYAMVRLTEPEPTWDLGSQVGELESLAVAEHARGRGIGTQLMDAGRDLLREHGPVTGRWPSWKRIPQPSGSTSEPGSGRTTGSYSGRSIPATAAPGLLATAVKTPCNSVTSGFARHNRVARRA